MKNMELGNEVHKKCECPYLLYGHSHVVRDTEVGKLNYADE